jgi:hypothetical protein
MDNKFDLKHDISGEPIETASGNSAEISTCKLTGKVLDAMRDLLLMLFTMFLLFLSVVITFSPVIIIVHFALKYW